MTRIVVRKNTQEDGSGYGAVYDFAAGGSKGRKKLNLVTYFRGTEKSLDAWWEKNKGANPAAVPNYPEPASSARDDVLAPSANSLPPSPAGGKPTNLQEGIAAARANAQAKKQAEASAKAQPPQAKFGEKFTVSIPFFGDIPYRSSQPFSAGNAEVVSSRVITTNTKITKNDANVLGLEPKPMVYAWRVSVVKHANGEFSSVIEAMNYDTGRTPDGEVVAYFKPVENQEAVNRIAPAIAKAALKDWQAQQGSVGLLLDAAMEPEATKSGPFGPIFEGFENNPEGAIAKLMQEKRGEVTDAFTHPELGKIGFVYGDNNMGLLHIANKRGMEWVNRIPEILKTGELVKDEGGLPRTYLVRRADTPPSVAVIRLDWDGKGKTWLVTAYPDDFGKFTKSKNPDNNQKHTGRVVDGASGFSGQSGQFDSATKSKTKQEVEDGSLDTARYTGKVDNPILDTQVARVAIANNYSDFKTWYDGYVAKRNAEVEQKTNRLEQLEDFLRAHSSEMRSVRPFAPKASASQAVQDAFAEWRPLNSESMNGLLYPIPPDRNPLQVWTNYRKRAQAEGIAVSSNGVDSAAVAEQNAAEAAPDYLPAGWKKSGAFYEFRNASGSEFTPSQVAEVLGGKARRAGAYWMTDVPYHQWEQAKAKLQAAGMWSDSQ
ncbi:MAG: hypothetical protein PHX60_02900 [Giesbergeria sp.]|uniref:putative barnase/colicin E5 family endoribonuclease n=1 Tax=Giesbergeria sp. TaxID=2818473 RepID=UPI0026085A22|nr:hypothetical protein [Giesbergeria sp.]MDD2608628.1 hypothetical protein [Giesbergeria sp.]